MIESISDKIRKMAAFIELDTTPSEVVIGDRKRVEEESTESKNEKKKVVSPGALDKLDPTAPAQQRRPREQPSHKNKWNEDTKTGLMNDYMKNYRADGKDKETDGPKSTYKKKFKG